MNTLNKTVNLLISIGMTALYMKFSISEHMFQYYSFVGLLDKSKKIFMICICLM